MELTDQPFIFANNRLYVDGGNLKLPAPRKILISKYSHLLEVEELNGWGFRPTCLAKCLKDEFNSFHVDTATEQSIRGLLEAIDLICLDETLSDEITKPLEKVFQALRQDFDNESKYRQEQAMKNSFDGPFSRGAASLRKTSKFQFQVQGSASNFSSKRDNRMVFQSNKALNLNLNTFLAGLKHLFKLLDYDPGHSELKNLSKQFVFSLDEDEVVIRVSDQLHEEHCVVVTFRPNAEYAKKANLSLKMDSKVNYSYLLINSLSHELITPIGQILANANSILRDHRDDSVVAADSSLTNLLGRASQKKLDRPAIKPDLHGSVSKIKQLSMGLSIFVQNLMDYARIINNNFTVHARLFNVHEMIQEALEVFELRAKCKDIALKVTCDRSLSLVNDREKLLGLVYTFLDNSVKFTKKGSVHLKVEYSPHLKACVFAIVDTGIGIDQKDFGHLSEIVKNPWLQDKTNSAAGLGIGFRMAVMLLKAVNKGQVSLEVSSKIGSGTTVKFSVKVHQDTDQPNLNSSQLEAPEANENEKKGVFLTSLSKENEEVFLNERKVFNKAIFSLLNHSARNIEKKVASSLVTDFNAQQQEKGVMCLKVESNMDQERQLNDSIGRISEIEEEFQDITTRKVLLVDDDIFNLELLKEILEDYFSFEVYVASDGERAIELCNKFLGVGNKIDLVLMDYHMPEMTGAELARALRDAKYHPILGGTPMVGITAHADSKTKNDCIEAGMNLVLNKPFSVSKIQEILDTYRLCG